MVALAGCRQSTPEGGAFEMPGRLVQALERFSDLEARAELVPAGEAPLEGVALERGSDGRSFTGFIDAAPGEYTIEIVFSGRFESSTDVLFLGRWPSNVFTVVDGASESPTFTAPLDTIGRPGDGGDTDADGLGQLDELLFGTDRNDDDSDDDGILDGDDCRPTVMSTARAARTGQLEDCDGDGELRPDRPIGEAGRDCDDEDPSINPAAEDICGDGIDQDCNPVTCADESRPVIELLEPAENEQVGCSQRIRARITSANMITNAEVRFLDMADREVDTLALTVEQGDVYRTREIAYTPTYLDPGPRRFRTYATDGSGKTSTVTRSIDLVFEVPSATMTPMTIGRQNDPFDIVVNANATAGVASIVLYQADVVDDEVLAEAATEVARSTSASLTYNVVPSSMPDGLYAYFAIVTDAVGNQLRPDGDFIPDAQPDGSLATDADYLCLFDSGSGNVPVRLLRTGMPSIQPAKMRDLLPQATMLAAARDPAAVPVLIRAFGIQADGTVPLDEETGGGGKWWRFTFFNFTDDRRVEVTWYSLADGIPSPEVEVTENDPFGFSLNPFVNVSTLADSDVVTAAFGNAAGCMALTGHTDDDLRYLSDEPFTSQDVVRISSAAGGMEWKATAAEPITEIWSCQ